MEIEFSLNGRPATADVDGHEAAVDVLREDVGLTGTKLVCAGGVCGACTVHRDGEPVATCLLPATQLDGRDVTTIEGLAAEGVAHPVQRAFAAHDGLQCGFCTPGFVMSAVAFHDRWRADHGTAEPDRHTIADALAGHLCRCGAYEGIFAAVAAACRGDHDGPGDTSDARIDATAKLTGAAVYTADVTLPGMAHAAIVRSPVAAAEVGTVEVPGALAVYDLLPDDRTVRWAGQPIAAVAAETRAEAQRLAASASIDLRPRPFVLDPEEAKGSTSPRVYEGRKQRKLAANAAEGPMMPAPWDHNVRKTNRLPYRPFALRRRLAEARESPSPALAELTFTTVPQMHTSFEPHCCVADLSRPGTLRAWVSTQAVDHIAHELAERFDVDLDQVDVVSDYVGGGFGSKLSMSPDIVAAAELSKTLGRPVKLVLDRREELTATGNRPGMSASVALLASDDGTDVRGLEMRVESHAGTSVNNLVGTLGMLVYQRSPRYASDVDVVTNAPPATPFRGPGGPLYSWALEQTVDQVAHQLEIDPVALRAGWDGNQRRQALYRWAGELDVWRGRPTTGDQSGRFRRGVGVAAANWMYFVDPDTRVELRVSAGRVVAECATQDMGTGSKTVIADAVAGVLGIDRSDVEVAVGRAGSGRSHGPTSGGSRTTPSVHTAAVLAAERLRDELGDTPLADADGATAAAERGGDHGMRAVPFTVAGIQVGRGFSGAVHVSEVEVDTRTGKIRVLSVHAGIATGRIHAPSQARSQCEGSVIQGVGLALYEQQVLDPHTGLNLTSNLEDYRIPQLGDTPEITVHFHEEGWDHVPGGGVGLGEVSTISPAASIGNAVFNATGWRPTDLPIRPDRVVEALR